MLPAGDAAHQTPPFAGQGLCSGLRDAANLAWKLDLVLRDLAPDAPLDAYGIERGSSRRTLIQLAIDMGKLICVADPDEAAARDAAFIAADDGGLTGPRRRGGVAATGLLALRPGDAGGGATGARSLVAGRAPVHLRIDFPEVPCGHGT